MDIEKLLKWATEYLSDYVSVFVATLRSPAARFQPVVNSGEPQHLTLPSSHAGLKLNPKLFGFMIISIFIGTSLHSITFGQSDSLDLTTTAMVTVAIWLVYSFTVYLFCWLIRGRATFWEVVSVTLQLLAVIYVVSNFIIFLWGSVAYTSMVRNLRSGGIIIDLLVMYPTSVYFVIQSVLMLFYLPIALKNVQGFGLIRLLAATIIPILWAAYDLYVYLGNFVHIVSGDFRLVYRASFDPPIILRVFPLLSLTLITIFTIFVIRKWYSER